MLAAHAGALAVDGQAADASEEVAFLVLNVLNTLPEVGALAARLPLPPGNFPTLWNAAAFYLFLLRPAPLIGASAVALLVVALTGGVLWSNVLAYHDVTLAPRASLALKCQ